jgi:hypothetical protein
MYEPFLHPYFSDPEFGVSLTFTSEESLGLKRILIGHLIPEHVKVIR